MYKTHSLIFAAVITVITPLFTFQLWRDPPSLPVFIPALARRSWLSRGFALWLCLLMPTAWGW